MKHQETAIAQAVVAYLSEAGWGVYQEVKYNQRIADIVATKGPILWAIECKVSNVLGAFDQALGWQHLAHFVSVAIPNSCSNHGSPALARLAEATGIGILRVWPSESPSPRDVRESYRARLHRNARRRDLAGVLREEQKTWAPAGCKTGDRFTPWKDTCRRLAVFVMDNPGCSMRDAIAGIRHHYGTDTDARASMMIWVREGKVPGVERVREGRRILLYPMPRGAEPIDRRQP